MVEEESTSGCSLHDVIALSKGKFDALDTEEPQRLSGTNSPGSSPPITKGYGLKKWRRIKRDVVKDQSTHLDSAKLLK
ncbi:hypothetical protein K1719_033907 [Acacia pycnantha]|nr:hypothetical protein K1719_033907 [Acacia pycnantha]